MAVSGGGCGGMGSSPVFGVVVRFQCVSWTNFNDDASLLIPRIVIRIICASSTTTGVVEQEEEGDGQDPVLFR